MRASDLLPIPNFGDPAGCVAITSDRSQAKATEGKAGMAGVTGPVRRSTAGTGLRVGESARTDRLSMPALGYASNVSEIGVTAGETAPILDDCSTAVRTFGPGDVLAKLETELAGFVAELNARDRLMRRHRLDYDDPPPLFLAERRDDSDPEPDQALRLGTASTLSEVLRALSALARPPVRGGLRP